MEVASRKEVFLNFVCFVVVYIFYYEQAWLWQIKKKSLTEDTGSFENIDLPCEL